MFRAACIVSSCAFRDFLVFCCHILIVLCGSSVIYKRFVMSSTQSQICHFLWTVHLLFFFLLTCHWVWPSRSGSSVMGRCFSGGGGRVCPLIDFCCCEGGLVFSRCTRDSVLFCLIFVLVPEAVGVFFRGPGVARPQCPGVGGLLWFLP